MSTTTGTLIAINPKAMPRGEHRACVRDDLTGHMHALVDEAPAKTRLLRDPGANQRESPEAKAGGHQTCPEIVGGTTG